MGKIKWHFFFFFFQSRNDASVPILYIFHMEKRIGIIELWINNIDARPLFQALIIIYW